MRKYLSSFLDLFLVLAIFLCINLLTYHFQAPITWNEGRGIDGVYYYEVAEQFAKGEPIQSFGPFVYRVGSSYLAALIDPTHLLRGFLISDVAANFLSAILMVFWFRFYISDWRLRVLLSTLLMAVWIAPYRFAYYYPAHNEPWAMVFIFGGFILIEKIAKNPSSLNIALFTALVFIGTMFKETIILLPLSLFFIHNPISPFREFYKITRKKFVSMLKVMFPIRYVIPLLACVLASLIVHSMVKQTDDYSMIRNAFGWGYTRSPFEYILSWLSVCGPIFFLCLYSWRVLYQFLWEHQHLLIYFLAILVAAWCGGWDVERYVLLGAPVIYVLIGLAILENKKLISWVPLAIILIVTQAIAERIFWTIPDHNPEDVTTQLPFLTVMSSKMRYYDMFANHGKHHIVMVTALFEYFALGILIFWMLNYRKKTTKSPPHK